MAGYALAPQSTDVATLHGQTADRQTSFQLSMSFHSFTALSSCTGHSNLVRCLMGRRMAEALHRGVSWQDQEWWNLTRDTLSGWQLPEPLQGKGDPKGGDHPRDGQGACSPSRGAQFAETAARGRAACGPPITRHGTMFGDPLSQSKE